MLNKPNYKKEKDLLKKGYQIIAGLDEAGRGCLAGPLVAGAVILKNIKPLKGLRDSKKMSPQQRERMFLKIVNHSLVWSVGIVEPEEIDEYGIIPANRMAFERAVKKLKLKPDYLLVDGIRNFDSNIKSEFVVKGDGQIYSIAAASVVAKVVRDKLMEKFHLKYPEYNLDKHKGYGTKEHFSLIEKHGPAEIHRFSFYPIKT